MDNSKITTQIVETIWIMIVGVLLVHSSKVEKEKYNYTLNIQF